MDLYHILAALMPLTDALYFFYITIISDFKSAIT